MMCLVKFKIVLFATMLDDCCDFLCDCCDDCCDFLCDLLIFHFSRSSKGMPMSTYQNAFLFNTQNHYLISYPTDCSLGYILRYCALSNVGVLSNCFTVYLLFLAVSHSIDQTRTFFTHLISFFLGLGGGVASWQRHHRCLKEVSPLRASTFCNTYL